MVHSYFEQQCSFKVDYAPAVIKKWISTRTKLQVTLIDQASPIVNGYFAVATEILNDSGCPHTLEHLVFMGSKKYPYKGLLDILGNLACSSTNAWTATDQTVYTLTTAGWEGFKMLLPIYLDHLFNPTLTDSACYTEVYHVDGEGKEKGVVYSEMQGIENQSWFIQNLASQRLLYKNSGYKSETGGLTKNLRTLEADTIRKYHADNYRPDNLCIIVTGTVEEKELLELITEFDSQLPSAPKIPNKRPFVDQPQDGPLTETCIKTVPFPDQDESSGDVSISWIGPDSRDTVSDQAVEVLLRYLTSSSVSLFNQEFVEIADPWAAGTSHYTESYVRTAMTITFDSVSTERQEQLPSKVLALLKDHCNEKKMDLVRLKDMVEQIKWQFVHSCEKSPEPLSDIAIYEFEYGKDMKEDLVTYCKTLDEFDQLMEWDISKWVEFFIKYFVDNHSAIVIASPSAELYEKNKKEGARLLEARIKRLGSAGLKELEEKLQKAQESNNKKIPDEILSSFGKPDLSKVKFIKTESIASGRSKDIDNKASEALTKIEKDTPNDFPLYVHFENYESNFISIDLLFSSFEIPQAALPLMGVFEELTKLPILGDDGKLIPYEEVVKQLKRDTIECHFGNSFNGKLKELMSFSMVVKSQNYEKAIDWYIKLLLKTKFTKDRVVVALNKLLKQLPDLKRSAGYMLNYIYNKHYYTDRSYLKSVETITNEEYLRNLLHRIEQGEFESIEKELNEIRSKLFRMSNIRVLVFGDVNRMKTPVSSWQKFVQSFTPESGLTDWPYQEKVFSKIGASKSENCYIVSTPGVDTNLMRLITKIPIFDFTSDDAFKILLGAEYLQAVEGPFWRGIRGAGLAYGANCYSNSVLGELCYTIYRGVDIQNCYKVAKNIVEGFASGATPIDDSLREGAVSSFVNKLASSQSNYFETAVFQFYDNVMLKRGPDFNKLMLEKLSAITNEELVEIFGKYFVNLFDPKKSICFISCNTAKADETKKFFIDQKYVVDVENVYVEQADDDSDASDDTTGSEGDDSEESDFDSAEESE